MAEPTTDKNPVKVPLFSGARERIGEFEVSRAVFGREGDGSLLHEAVRMQLARRRRGNAATKTRTLVSGGGRKPWRQKGTGRARAGSTRSPLWRHGGTTFGPQPRDYSYKMPKQAWRHALCLALSDRALAGKMVVVESLDIAEPKTKAASAFLKALGVGHALIVFDAEDANFVRAARNLAAHKVLPVAGLNAYDVLNYAEIVMSAKVAREIERRFSGAVR
jgi:large subunit ribosomal protein L4